MLHQPELAQRAQARVGTTIGGKYRIDAVLGIGGMAVVYAATRRNRAEFAIKILHPEFGLREDVRTRFLREGYTANSVKHPGAVRVVDDDVAEDGTAFLLMELLHGVVVDALLERGGGRLGAPAAAAIVSQLLDVLSAAHGKGIIHRDIKPANLCLTTDGMVKVLDFGIARAKEVLGADASGASMTGTGMLLGTPAFMAP
jgi:serine/threonine protein kinase